MAKEHHCPKCGTQSCNALSGNLHVCPTCTSQWEEEIVETKA